MARKGGKFNFAKRAKELKKQKKRQEKLERKRGNSDSPVEDEIVSLDEALDPSPPPPAEPVEEAPKHDA